MPNTTRPLAATAVVAVVVGACAEEPPALTVGPVSYTQNQLLGLSDAREGTLGHLTAFGLAVADSTTDELGAPLVSEMVDQRLAQIVAAELTLEKNGVTDEVLEARYLTDPQWELTVRHILFFSERWRPADHREQARQKAARAMELLRGGADFAETAAQLSEEPGAEGRQGLLQPGREGSWVPEFWAAALALEPSEISPVTETQYGYHILELHDRRVVPFGEGRTVVAREVAHRIEDPNAVLDAWLGDTVASDEDARRAAVAGEAERRGLRVPEGERSELSRQWDDRVHQWSVSLGFRYGLTPGQVATAALAALANPAQNAGLTRDALDAHAGLLEARYPIERPAGGGAS